MVVTFSGELEESMAELEESRRKLVNLKMQKDGPSAVHTAVPVVPNGTVSPEKPADRTKRLRELRDSIEETKVHIISVRAHMCLFFHLLYLCLD